MEEQAESVRGAWWLTIGRLAIAFILLLASALWLRDQYGGAPQRSALQEALPVFVVVV